MPWSSLQNDPVGVLFSGTTSSSYRHSNNPATDDLESPGAAPAQASLSSNNEFDFSKNRTKMVYAGAKFCVALVLALIYIILFKVLFTLPYIKTQ